jgi:hypothetical protein
MAMVKSFSAAVRLAGAITLTAMLGCNGFGVGNATSPGSTPSLSAQIVYRVVGNLGTPFVATISDSRSSWTINGVVPLNILVVNIPTISPGVAGPTRLIATKLANDSTLLSIEIISGFDVRLVDSTFAHYGTVVGGLDGELDALAPHASPDVRYFVKGPANGIFNAVIEDVTTAFALQSRVPTVILHDSPNGGSQSGRVDGIFNLVGGGGPLNIDLIFNGALVAHAVGGGTQIVKFH